MAERYLTVGRVIVIGLAMVIVVLPPAKAQEPIRRVTLSPSGSGFPTDAVVVNRGNLVHSGQFFATAKQRGDAGFADLLNDVRSFCETRGGTLAEVVKLNLYLAEDRPETVTEVESAIRQAWPEGTAPAVTLVSGALPGGASLSGDVVMRRDAGGSNAVVSSGEAATMPAGRDILYVSGRAASGEIAEATSGTMTQLFDVLAHLGSGPADVVQVKAFIQPMDQWEVVEREIAKSFGDRATPPVVIVEWTSTSRATEIELIAAAPDRSSNSGTVSYFTPPGDKASPVYSRVARVQSDTLIYTSGLHAEVGSDSMAELKRVFARLGEIGGATDSDLRHLVKATYYVSDDELSAKLNEIRPSVYDPERPPAASKVAVGSVGRKGCGLLMDFIAVPKPGGR